MSRNRYSRWDGTQEPFGAELPVDELADQPGRGRSRRLGYRQQPSPAARERHGRPFRRSPTVCASDSTPCAGRSRSVRVDRTRWLGVKEKLAEVERLERQALASDPGEEARFAELDLDTLPDNTAARIRPAPRARLAVAPKRGRSSRSCSTSSVETCSTPRSARSAKACRTSPPRTWNGSRTCWPTSTP